MVSTVRRLQLALAVALAVGCGVSAPSKPGSAAPASPAALASAAATPTESIGCPAVGAPAPYAVPASIRIELRPVVATVGCDETFALTVRPSTIASSVRLKLRSGETIALQPGDANTFTATLRSAQVLFGWTPQTGNHNVVGDLEIIGARAVEQPYLTVLVRHDRVPSAAVTRLAADAQATARVLNLYDPAPGAVGPRGRGFDPATYTKRLYELYGDDFDFVNVVYSQASLEVKNHTVVKNAVQGIGLPITDRSVEYGSAGRLQGLNSYRLPGSFDLAAESFSHETAHQWVNYVTRAPLTNPGAHWPYSSLATGPMGYSIAASGEQGRFAFRAEPAGGDLYRLVSDSSPDEFSDLELYLMGLVAADRVRPEIVFVDQRTASMRAGVVLQGVTVRVDDVIAAHGPRVPAAGSAQTHFTVGTIVVSHDRLLTSSELTFFDHMAARVSLTTPIPVSEGRVVLMQNPWAVATRGLSTMDPVMRPKAR